MRTLDAKKIQDLIDTICPLLNNLESVNLLLFHKKSDVAQKILKDMQAVQASLTSVTDKKMATEQMLEKICYTIASHLATCYIQVQGNLGIVSKGRQDLMHYFHDTLGVQKGDNREIIQSTIYTNILAKVDVLASHADSSLKHRS